MGELKLVKPSEEYLESYLEACRENVARGVSTYTLHDPEMFGIWRFTIFKEFERQSRGWLLSRGYVPSTTLWSVMDGRFVGTGNIRHKLNASLRRYGGHIGYAIRPSMWGGGLGTVQLRLLLDTAAQMDIDPALITCNLENRASARVIEKNGGRFVDVVPNHINGQDIKTCRFWVPTGPGPLGEPDGSRKP